MSLASRPQSQRSPGRKRECPHLDEWRSWYQLERWRRIRRAQLRAEPLCRFCLDNGRVTQATIADHVVSHGGDWNQFLTGKLQSLCKPCHDGFKKLGDGIPQIDEHGWPVD